MSDESDDSEYQPVRPQRCGPRPRTEEVPGNGHGEEPETDTEETELEEGTASPSSDAESRRAVADPLMALQSAAEDAAADMRIEQLRQAALREAKRDGLHLVLAPGTKSGYKGVHFKSSKSKPYQATACGNRKNQHLGHFVTAQEAALCYARHIGKEAAAAEQEKQLAVPPEPQTAAAKEAVRMAAEEGLELVRVPSANSGYKGVIYLPHRNRPFQARLSRGTHAALRGWRP